MDNNLPKNDPVGTQIPSSANDAPPPMPTAAAAAPTPPQSVNPIQTPPNTPPAFDPSAPMPSVPPMPTTTPESSMPNPTAAAAAGGVVAAAPANNESHPSLFLPDGHEMNHHGSGIKIIIGILVVGLILLAGGFFLMQNQQPSKTEQAIVPTTPPTPTTNPTANWLTYTDTNSGFSIQYPPDGAFEKGKPYDGTNGDEEVSASFILGDSLLTILPNYKQATFTPIKTETIIVGTVKAQKDYESSNSAVIKAIPLSNESTISFTYKLPDDPAKAQMVNALFDQILKTFSTNATTSSQLLIPEEGSSNSASLTAPAQ